jgi:hypothetical protein
MEDIPDYELTAEQLDDKYNLNGDGEHPVLTRDEWRNAVAMHETSSGYWDWLCHRMRTPNENH